MESFKATKRRRQVAGANASIAIRSGLVDFCNCTVALPCIMRDADAAASRGTGSVCTRLAESEDLFV